MFNEFPFYSTPDIFLSSATLQKNPAKSIFMIHLAGFYKPEIIKILL